MTTFSAKSARAGALLGSLFLAACSSSNTFDPGDGSSVQTGGAQSGGGTVSSGGTSSIGGGSGGGLTSGGSASGGGGNDTSTGGAQGCADASSAYQGTPAVIPGTIEAENFDVDGYQDDTPGNEGGEYRMDVDVDIKAFPDGHAVGWMTPGEWLEYTVNVQEAGRYTVTLRAGAVQAGRTLELSVCGQALTTLEAPVVSDWGEMDTVEASVELSQGLQVIRLTVGSNRDVDIDALTFTREGPGGGSGGASPGAGGSDTGGAPPAAGGSNPGTGGGEHGKFVGNITTGNSIDYNGLIFSDYWDQITPENAGKWGSVQGNISNNPNWATLDAIYDYTEKKGIIFKQHAFVWGSQQPSGQISENHVKEWMRAFCQRYPNTKLIDVVNEPPPHTTPSYANNIGGGTNGNWQWITNAFKWAREACPNAILIFNDYNNIEWPNDNQHFIDITKTVLQNGGPIDALGAQSHDLDHGSVTFQTVERLLNKLHNDTGLPVYITELDLSTTDDQQQLTLYQRYMPFFMETDFVPGVTIWGWIYGRTWNQAPNSGLVRDGRSRSAMTWLMNELGRPAP
jgi:endo-1,4-beta-xylanase